MIDDTTQTLLAGPLRIPLAEIDIGFARSGGPGGQNVNKRETKVHLRWSIPDSPSVSDELKQRLLERLPPRHLTADGLLILSESGSREQGENRRRAFERLAALMERALETQAPRKATRPTKASKRRRVDDKKRRGERKKQRRKRWPDA